MEHAAALTWCNTELSMLRGSIDMQTSGQKQSGEEGRLRVGPVDVGCR